MGRIRQFSFIFFFLIAGVFLFAAGCTSEENKNMPVLNVGNPNQEDFAEDTTLILEYHKRAASYLFRDAEKAMFYAKHVLRLSMKHQWAKGKILAYNLLSTYYLLDGSYDVVRELANETLILADEVHYPIYRAHAKRFIAETYSEYRQWDSAQINYRQAIAIFEREKADSAKALTIENLGNSYREKFQYDSAWQCYEQAYLIFDTLNSDWGRSMILQSKGYLKVTRNDHEAAERYFLASLDLSRKTKNRYGELNTLNDLSNSYYHNKKYDQAIQTGLKAHAYSKIYHSTQQINWALVTLSKCYKAKGMYETALRYSEQALHLKRMVHDETIKRQYTMYQLSYENQAYNLEIQKKIISEQQTVQQVLIGVSIAIIIIAVFLFFNNKKLRQKNAEIKEALIQGQTIERKRVAAELHDHLGGTLASLNWYLYGIDKKVLSPQEQKIYDSVHQMVGAAYREVRSLSHNLMPVELEEEGLVTALALMVDKLNENKNIAFHLELSGMDDRLNNKIEFELYSIVRELTNNIIKHSKATEATIRLTGKPKSVMLTVEDNGTGMIEPSRQGMGLKNVKNRVDNLRGRISIANEEQRGARIEVEIAKNIVR